MDEHLDKQDDLSADQMVKELRATFREEAYELLTELESALLEVEKTPDDREQIGRAFRAMHTIKGSGGACEFHDIVKFTHELETIFDRIRNRKANATGEIISLTLAARDQIKAMLDQYYRGGSVEEAKSGQILDSLRKLVPGAEKDGKTGPAPVKKHATKTWTGRAVSYRVRFRPHADIFAQGIDPVHLLTELFGLGPCKIVAQTEAIPYLEEMDPQACYTYWDVILSTGGGLNAIQDVFIFVKDSAELTIDVIDDEGHLDREAAYKKLGEILLDRKDLSAEDLHNVLKSQKRIGEILVESGVIGPSKVESALVEQQHVREIREQRQGADAASSIRVATEKLDSLVNLVGELVTVQARLSQTALSLGVPELQSIAEEVERLTASIRDNTMNIRMLPIGTTFSKFKRLVRDLSAELGKEIELTTDGAETELDKTVIERLSDPLVHIIRNCADHGIEHPSMRVAAGKPKCGTIHLSAIHSGAHVLIRVADDGAGLDTAAIREKATEKGLIAPDAEPTERELRELIFAPGFSTAKTVTGVSGRGVGMDVVRKAIDALRGTIDVDTQHGAGTTITLKLPLTLAIIDGFLTRIGEEHFIFPLSSVEECIELTRKNTPKSSERHLVNVRGNIVPYIRLREQFLLGGEAPAIEQVVIVSEEGRRIGFAVDTVVGEHQTVIKSLGRFYKEVEGISGATVLGDGTVALILDLAKLVLAAEQEETLISCRTGGPND
jgi:two-component system chemotaxis sensor kinase CheA